MGYATGQFGKNHLGDLNEFLPTVHGFDEFYGYLYHLDAMEDPCHPNYPQDLRPQVGPRNMVHSRATDKDDPTVMPRWGKVGKQKIEGAGELCPKRTETVDDEIRDKALAFLDKAKADGKPFFLWLNPTRMHIVTHLWKCWNVMSKLIAKLEEEIVALLPPTIFFFITLHLVAVMRVLILEGTGIPVSTSLQVTIAALILGKAVLIADLLPFINLYPHKPLIYNVVWKTAIYLLVAMFVHYLERLADFWKEAGSLLAGNQKLLAEMVWPHFWAVQILLLVLIASYCTIHELVRAIGRDKVLEMFFE